MTLENDIKQVGGEAKAQGEAKQAAGHLDGQQTTAKHVLPARSKDIEDKIDQRQVAHLHFSIWSTYHTNQS